jgi:hypothetical protein
MHFSKLHAELLKDIVLDQTKKQRISSEAAIRTAAAKWCFVRIANIDNHSEGGLPAHSGINAQ